MKIVDYMSFTPDWFLTLPGMLITGGVVLLLVALVILLTSNKKKDKEKEEETNGNTISTPVEPATPELASDTVAMQNDTLNMGSMPAQGLSDITTLGAGDFNTTPAPAEPSIQASVSQEPIDFTVMTSQQPQEQPAPVVFGAPTAPEINVPETPAEPATQSAITEEVKPAVSVYGGVSPTESVFKPVEQAAPVIYGGADPLENTAPLPRVETHTLYNQPEAKVVEPVKASPIIDTPAVLNNPEPTIPDLSAFVANNAPVQEPAPVEQPVIQTTVTPAAPEVAQTPIVKEEIETLDF